MIEKQLSLFLVNKPGVLAEVCKTLGNNGVNIRGMSISDTVDHAVVRVIVDDADKAIHVLGDHGVLVVETDVLALRVSDHPGEMAKVARKLARAKINIEYAYGSSDGSSATMFVRVSDARKAKKLLTPAKKKKTARKKRASTA
jgi:hypothetical protein